MVEKTTSTKPSQEQLVADIRNMRKDLDAMIPEVQIVLDIVSEKAVRSIAETGFLVVAIERLIEARMWLGRALEQLGEVNTSENHDKAEEPRESVAPSRSKGTR